MKLFLCALVVFMSYGSALACEPAEETATIVYDEIEEEAEAEDSLEVREIEREIEREEVREEYDAIRERESEEEVSTVTEGREDFAGDI